jgi:hypothetical protein
MVPVPGQVWGCPVGGAIDDRYGFCYPNDTDIARLRLSGWNGTGEYDHIGVYPEIWIEP